MAYTLVRPPPPYRPFRERSKKELQEYIAWFFAIMDDRMRELAAAVRETSGFEVWRPDYTPSSLEPLGPWFETQIETRPLTQEEINRIADSYKFPVPIPVNDRTLSERTYSLAIDIGMYFGSVLQKNHPSLKWKHELQDKKFADYGQPVLTGFRGAPLNPIRIATVLAYGIANKKKTGRRLAELYSVWEGMVDPNLATFV